MVKRLGILVFCLLPVLAGSAFADVAIEEDEDAEFMPQLHRANLPDIDRLEIFYPSFNANADNPRPGDPDCSQFVVTEADVSSFLTLTSEISEQDYMHTIAWVPCQASGEVYFTDGTNAKWSLMLSSGGRLDFAEGRTVYLYCEKCKAPFVPY